MSLESERHSDLTFATLVYVALIAYGTLFSTATWQLPFSPVILQWTPLGRASSADMLENALGYIPLGLLLALRTRVAGRGPAVLLATFFGFLLSLTMELLQVFVPGRVSSSVDLLLNTIGAFAGASMVAFVGANAGPTRALGYLRRELFVAGRLGNLGVAAIALWVASQLSPFVPTLDVSTVRHGLSHAWQTIQHPSMFNLSQSATYGCSLVALGTLWTLSCSGARGAITRYTVLVVLVLGAKPFFVSRVLSLEALVAVPGCVPLLLLQRTLPPRPRALIGAIVVAAGFFIYELFPLGGPTQALNWVPFRSEINNTLNGLTNALSMISTFFLLGALTSAGVSEYRRREAAILGALVVTAAVGGCEWVQQYIPGRTGDITTVAVALAGWILPWRFGDTPADKRAQ